MVEVVVDSNVILRALFFGDKYSMILLQKEAEHKIRFVFNKEMKRELCMKFASFLLRYGADISKANRLTDKLSTILKRSKEVGHNTYSNLCTEDRSDNKFIDCAIDSKSGFIITEDSDLSGLEGIICRKDNCIVRILSPYQFITEYL